MFTKWFHTQTPRHLPPASVEVHRVLLSESERELLQHYPTEMTMTQGTDLRAPMTHMMDKVRDDRQKLIDRLVNDPRDFEAHRQDLAELHNSVAALNILSKVQETAAGAAPLEPLHEVMDRAVAALGISENEQKGVDAVEKALARATAA